MIWIADGESGSSVRTKLNTIPNDGTTFIGVPTAGTTNQVLAKASNTNFDTAWVDSPGGGGLAINPTVTPHPGGGQASAIQLLTGINPCLQPVTTSDSLQLPPAVAGAIVMVLPLWTPAAGVYASVWAKNGSSDTIKGASGDPADVGTALAIAGLFSQVPVWFVCNTDGNWLVNCDLD